MKVVQHMPGQEYLLLWPHKCHATQLAVKSAADFHTRMGIVDADLIAAKLAVEAASS